MCFLSFRDLETLFNINKRENIYKFYQIKSIRATTIRPVGYV